MSAHLTNPAAAADPGDEAGVPSFSEQLAEQLGGVRGLIESSIPVVVFVVATLVAPRLVDAKIALRVAVVAAVGAAILMAGYRLLRRESVRHAINGVFGILIGAAVAWRTGDATTFYLPGILIGLGYGLAMLVSVVVRRPLVGWLWSIVMGGGSTQWRHEPRLVRTFSWLTVLWAGIYLAKVALQVGLYLTDQLTQTEKASALGLARLALGYPPYLLLLAVTVWAVRRTSRTLPPAELPTEA